MPTTYASGAVIPASDTMNWVKNRAAMAGAMWVIACMVTPTRPREFCRSSVRSTGAWSAPEAGPDGPPPDSCGVRAGSGSCMAVLPITHENLGEAEQPAAPLPGESQIRLNVRLCQGPELGQPQPGARIRHDVSPRVPGRQLRWPHQVRRRA